MAASWTGSGDAASDDVGLALVEEEVLLVEPGFAAVGADEALADVSFGLLSEGWSELELLFVVTTGDFEDLEELK